MTQMGVILGTAAYMAPEQARGKVVDRRADIWAFGCVLFEMLTGRSAFEGDSMTEVLGAVVLKEPDWTLLPSPTPARVRELLLRCLEKDPKRRLRDIGDAVYELNAVAGPVAAQPYGRNATRLDGCRSLSALGAVVASLASVGLKSLKPDATDPPEVSVSGLAPLLFDRFQSLTLRPDGGAHAFRGRGEEVSSDIYIRDFDSLEFRALAGTEGGRMPFLSPDGEWVGIFLGQLAQEGSPVRRTSADDCRGARAGRWYLAGRRNDRVRG